MKGNILNEFEKNIAQKLQIVSSSSINPRAETFSGGGQELLGTINELADNIMLSKSAKESKTNLEDIRNINVALNKLNQGGIINSTEHARLSKIIKSLNDMAVKDFNDMGGWRSGQTLKIKEENIIIGKLKAKFKGYKKYATVGGIAGVLFDSPALLMGAAWLSESKRRQEENTKTDEEQQNELMKSVYKESRREKTKKIQKAERQQVKQAYRLAREREQQELAKAAVEEIEKEEVGFIDKIQEDILSLLKEGKVKEEIKERFKNSLQNSETSDKLDNMLVDLQNQLEMMVEGNIGKGGASEYSPKDIIDLQEQITEVNEKLDINKKKKQLLAISKQKNKLQSRKQKSPGYDSKPKMSKEDRELRNMIFDIGDDEEASRKYLELSEEDYAQPSKEMRDMRDEGFRSPRISSDTSEADKDELIANAEKADKALIGTGDVLAYAYERKKVDNRDAWLKGIHDNIQLYMENAGYAARGKKSKSGGDESSGGGGDDLLDSLVKGKFIKDMLGKGKGFGIGVLKGATSLGANVGSGGVAAVMGQAIAVAGAAYVGYEIGTFINDKMGLQKVIQDNIVDKFQDSYEEYEEKSANKNLSTEQRNKISILDAINKKFGTVGIGAARKKLASDPSLWNRLTKAEQSLIRPKSRNNVTPTSSVSITQSTPSASASVAVTPTSNQNSDFDSAIEQVLMNEGNMKRWKVENDAGKGRTVWGINETANPEAFPAIWNMSAEESREYAKQIYKKKYWDPLKSKSTFSFDAAVNMGVGQANKWAGLSLEKQHEARNQRYMEIAQQPGKAKYLNEWINRSDKMYKASSLQKVNLGQYASNPQPAPTQVQQQGAPTIINNTSVVQQPDYRFYIEDLMLRLGDSMVTARG
jgi:hypothetical protein